MNKLVIPPSPNWYEANILACSPDNTLIYGARNDIIVVSNTPPEEAADVRIITRAHSQKIVSVNVNKNWGAPNKLAVTVAEDKIVKLWDIDALKKKISHNGHMTHEKVVGATFAGEDRVISVSENGVIIVWNILANETTVIQDLLGPRTKVNVTCLSTCPHANWLTAFGLKNGLIVVTDLRRNGKVLYKLRGHDKSVLSLAWCPAPVNVFPISPMNTVGTEKPKKQEDDKIAISENSDNLLENNASEEKLSTSDDQKTNLETPDQVEEISSSNDDFLKECLELKNKILGIQTSDVNKAESDEKDNVLINDDKECKMEENVNSQVDEKSSSNDDFLKACLELQNKRLGNETCDVSKPESKEKDNVLISDNKECKIEENDNGQVEQRSSSNDELMRDNVLISDDKECKMEENENDESENKNKNKGSENESADNSENQQNSSKITLESKEESVSKREIPINSEVEEPRKEFLLASAGRESNIYIWRAGTDGRMQTFFTVPKGHKGRNSKTQEKLWIVLCWVSPTKLLSGSRNAELIQWTLPKPKDINKQYRIIHKDHNSVLFSIAAPVQYYDSFNWCDEKVTGAWTTGQERLILNTSLDSERKTLNCIPTFGGSVNVFATSPLDPSRLAIGTGEGIIKIWDQSRPHTKNIVMSWFFHKIQSKVTALAWHPKLETTIAYGTLEGRVGYLDAGNKSKMPSLFPHYFKSEIYKVQWAPINDSKELGLYVLGEGKLVIFDANKSVKEPIEVDLPDNTFAYNFSWKPDYSLMLLSAKSGILYVYAPDLKIKTTLYLNQRLFNISWHPDSVTSNTESSAYCNYFAGVLKTCECVIYNLKEDAVDEVCKFDCHGEIINAIAWSPFGSDRIVIANDGGVAEVHDIKENKTIATYTHPNFEGITSVIWSTVDADHIIVGTKDHTMVVWKISEHPPKTKQEVKSQKQKVLKEINKETQDLLPKIEEKPAPMEKPKANKIKNQILPKFYNHKNSEQLANDIRKLMLWREKKENVEISVGDNEDTDILEAFGNNSNILGMIERNQKVLKRKGKFVASNTLSLFKGDISSAIKEAIELKKVDPWIISMAPMVSPKLWQDACLTYAQQLSEQSDCDPIECATYFLACHKFTEAVSVLCEHNMFAEALTLAKARLPEESCEIVEDILNKWAKNAMLTGSFERSAQCYVALGKYEEAATILFRRSDVEILKIAVELAEKSGNTKLHEAVLFRYSAFKNEQESTAKTAEDSTNKSLEEDRVETADEASLKTPEEASAKAANETSATAAELAPIKTLEEVTTKTAEEPITTTDEKVQHNCSSKDKEEENNDKSQEFEQCKNFSENVEKSIKSAEEISDNERNQLDQSNQCCVKSTCKEEPALLNDSNDNIKVEVAKDTPISQSVLQQSNATQSCNLG